MKKLILIISLSLIILTSCSTTKIDTANEKVVINTLLDDWHAAAANGDYDGYFGKIADDGIYVGTDATENWNKSAFSTFSKQYFDRGKAWDFKPLERNIYFSKDGKTAWFDELLDTWMKACRGSGVLEKVGNEWKIKHYVLSMTVPNDVTQEVLLLKGRYEDELIKTMKNRLHK